METLIHLSSLNMITAKTLFLELTSGDFRIHPPYNVIQITGDFGMDNFTGRNFTIFISKMFETNWKRNAEICG